MYEKLWFSYVLFINHLACMDGFHPAGLGPLGPLMFMSAPLSPRNLRHSSERVAIVERILGVNPQLIQSSHRFRLAQQGFELLPGAMMTAG